MVWWDLGKESAKEHIMRFSLLASAMLMAAWTSSSSAQDQNSNQPEKPNTLTLAEEIVGGRNYRDWLRDISANDPALKERAMQAMVIFASEPRYVKEVRKDAGPLLIGVLNDTYTTDVSIKVNAALAVGTIGLDEKDMDRGVSSLIRQLSDNESIVRMYATSALANIGSDARAAIPSMARMVRDKASWEIRRAAVLGLTRMAWDKNVKEGGPDPRAFKALTEAVSDRCLQVRQEAIKGFIFVGPPLISTDPKKPGSTKADHTRAVEALEQLTLSQKDKSTAILARVAILWIDPPRLNNPQTVDKYVQEISRFMGPRGESQVRIDAAYALTLIWQFANSKRVTNPPDPKSFTPKAGWGEAIHTAILNLSDNDDTMICWGCNVLGTMGSAAEKAIKDLEKAKARLANRKDNDMAKQMVQWALTRCHGKEANQVGAAAAGSGP
jgi:HEAT repeat protein